MAAQFLAGLSEEEVARRLRTFGPNELSHASGRNLLKISLETMREPMFLLLLAAACLYLVLGDLSEGLLLFAGAGASVGLVIYQEGRSERALAALRELAQPQARVIREGVEKLVAARDLAPGDTLIVGEGERLPADGYLASGDVLSVDESALTGESAPVSKEPAGEGATCGAQDGAHALYSGTLVVRGQGVVKVTRTGAQSALGRISRSLAEIVQEPTPLQRATGRIVTLLGLVALAFCGVVAGAYGVLRHDWIEGGLAGLTVAISLIPEEFPMVLAVFLAVGAWRLARHRVLARRSAVIETLGATTVLCADKTGTITENRMKLVRTWTREGEAAVLEDKLADASAGELLKLAALASAVRPVDPMDKAVHAAAPQMRGDIEPSQGGPQRTWPLRPQLMAVVQLWRLTTGGEVVAAKGAPEAIFRLCQLPHDERRALETITQTYARQGLRVLAVASARAAGDFGDEPLGRRFEFAGLLGFMDPIRAAVPAALAEARSAGIRVVMITGDHPETASAIARLAGIVTDADVLTGPDLEVCSGDELRERIRSVQVFARITPDQKLRLVEAFKANGEVVAMTGDGVNDAPALQAAHIGVAMGRRGTDVAREAADLVLLDDSFASIVAGVRLGRRIFANLRKALAYITAIHVPIAGLALAPVLLGLPPLLFPMHVVLLELAIDPTCSLVFEAEPSEASVMRRPPRRPDEPLFGVRHILLASGQGAAVFAATLGLYGWALDRVAEADARGVAFVALISANLALAAAGASGGRLFGRERRILWIIVAGLAGAVSAIFALPDLARLFSVAPPPVPLLGMAIAAGAASGGLLPALATNGLVGGLLRRTWPT